MSYSYVYLVVICCPHPLYLNSNIWELIFFGCFLLILGAVDARRGPGIAAVWVARNRFAVLDKTRTILIKDLSNEVSIYTYLYIRKMCFIFILVDMCLYEYS